MVSNNSTATAETPPSLAGAIDLLRLASRWRSPAEWAAAEASMDFEPEPSHLNTLNSSGLFHIVSTDKMSVRYAGTNHHDHDVGVVQADRPAPTRRVVYYFEMTVKNVGVKGQTSIGFTTESFKMRRQPGSEINSCGYHGEDGYLYRGGKGESFGPKFGAGDTIGAGINFATQEFFFTKNGSVVGFFAKDIKGPLYPTIAVHSHNEEVTVNFGKQEFLFDVEGFINEQRLKQQSVLETLPLQPDISHWMIRSYLMHYGYQDTLTAFDLARETDPEVTCENGFAEPLELYGLNNRKALRELIMKGDIDSAFQKLREWYPQVIQDEMSVICFVLHSQKFIELVRVGQLEDSVNYARAHLGAFFKHKQLAELLKDTVALLAYERPSESCVGYLLEHPQREFVADAVNAAVLSTNPNLKNPESCMGSCLEKLLRQLTVCSLERRRYSEDQGEAFFLHREVYTTRKKV